MFSKHLNIVIILLLIVFNNAKSQIAITPTSGCSPLTGVLFNSSGSGLSNILWDFGDGASSIDTIAYHTYSNPGVYNVIITGQNNNGNQFSDTTIIEVFENPIANFQLESINLACTPYSAAFSDSSYAIGAASIVSSNWTFGDGATLQSNNQANVLHTYVTTGFLMFRLR